MLVARLVGVSEEQHCSAMDVQGWRCPELGGWVVTSSPLGADAAARCGAIDGLSKAAIATT